MTEEGSGFPFPRLRAEALRRASKTMTESGDLSKYCPSLYEILSCPYSPFLFEFVVLKY